LRSPLFEESLHVQFSVGSLGNELMGALVKADLGDRGLAYFGEVMQDCLLDLLDKGTLQSATVTSHLSAARQDRLFADADRYAEDLIIRPTDVSNSPTLGDRFAVVAANSALEIDLYVHVSSTHIGGLQVVNGIGGSGDFVRNAPLSIVVLSLTTAGGDVSQIVPMVSHL